MAVWTGLFGGQRTEPAGEARIEPAGSVVGGQTEAVVARTWRNFFIGGRSEPMPPQPPAPPQPQMAAKQPGFSPGRTPIQTPNAPPWSLAKDTGFQGVSGLYGRYGGIMWVLFSTY